MHPRQKEVRWTPEIAYAVGLITTDGCLYKDGRHFDFTSKDKDLIYTFKQCLDLKNRIARKSNGAGQYSFRVQFGNVTLYRWLLNVGLMPNKSKRLGPLVIPDYLFFDFLRGHLDGDGSIKRYQDPIYPNSTRLYVSFMSASLPHLLWLRRKVKQFADISGFMRTVSRAHTLTYSKYDSIKLLKFLYPTTEIPCLKRKFEIAKEFLAMPRW